MFSNCYKQGLQLKATINFYGDDALELVIKAVSIAVLILLSNASFAHPGRTASDGCHYCRTNCTEWGVPWNVRHCHNLRNRSSAPLIEPSRTMIGAGNAFKSAIESIGGYKKEPRSQEDIFWDELMD